MLQLNREMRVVIRHLFLMALVNSSLIADNSSFTLTGHIYRLKMACLNAKTLEISRMYNVHRAYLVRYELVGSTICFN